MQAEGETLILYHTDLRGEWPEAAARDFAAGLPYARRLAMSARRDLSRASVAGVALALQALSRLVGRSVRARELTFARGEKPRMAGPDFSISHSGPWVGCAAVTAGRVGFDVELGSDARRAHWVACEALVKATGEGLRAVGEARALSIEGAAVDWRGTWWHLLRPAMFPGAAACVASSRRLRAIEPRFTALAELFAS